MCERCVRVCSWSQQGKLVAADPGKFDYFGSAVDISGEYTVVGNPRDDDAGHDTGSAYIFVHSSNDWVQQAKLTANDAPGLHLFGVSVGISGTLVAVGTGRRTVHGSSAAYIFVRSNSTWSQQAKLIPSDATTHSAFGRSIGISGQSVVIGATDNNQTGCAYIFEQLIWTQQSKSVEIWTQQSKLTMSNATYSFGVSVGIIEGMAVVGAPNNSSSSGSTHIFVRSNDNVWTLQAVLTAANATGFGHSVSISEGVVVVGAPDANDGNTSSGSVYTFAQSDTTWTQQAKLSAADSAAWDRFGFAVDISETDIVVGAPNAEHHETRSNAGAAYTFTRANGNGWSQTARLTAKDSATDDNFGTSVALSTNYAVVGSNHDDNGALESGSAYVLLLRAPTAAPTTTPTTAPSFPPELISQVIAFELPGGASDYAGDTKTACEFGYFSYLGIMNIDGASYLFMEGWTGTSTADTNRRASVPVTFSASYQGAHSSTIVGSVASTASTMSTSALTAAITSAISTAKLAGATQPAVLTISNVTSTTAFTIAPTSSTSFSDASDNTLGLVHPVP